MDLDLVYIIYVQRKDSEKKSHIVRTIKAVCLRCVLSNDLVTNSCLHCKG